MLRLCSHRCPHMHEITLEQTRDSLQLHALGDRRARADPHPRAARSRTHARRRAEDRLSDPLRSDVLIIGCGIGGGTAALALAEAGLRVTIVTRADRAGGVQHALGAGRHHLQGRGRLARIAGQRHPQCRCGSLPRRSRAHAGDGRAGAGAVDPDRQAQGAIRSPSGRAAGAGPGGRAFGRRASRMRPMPRVAQSRLHHHRVAAAASERARC